jgi:hypothetical protein
MPFTYSLAFSTQTALVLFHFSSAIVFILDLTNRDVVSMGYTCIVWPLVYALLTITVTTATSVYIQSHRRSNNRLETSERAELFYPRYQQTIFSAFTDSILLFIIGLTCVIVVGVDVGLSFEPHNELVHDIATVRYNFSHFILVGISILSMFEQLHALLTLVGHIYMLNDLPTIVQWATTAKHSVLIFDEAIAKQWIALKT